MSKSTTPKRDIQQEVTDKIVAALEDAKGWHKPWSSPISPRNFHSKKPYRGINVLLTGMQGYESPWWLSYKQAQAKGGQVRGGEKGTLIVFWKPLEIKDPDAPNGKKTIFYLKHSTVFNAEQIDGIEFPTIDLAEFNPDEDGDRLIQDWSDNESTISYGGDRAYYRRTTDEIQLPPREHFESPEAFYLTAFHEMIHSTGHETRLKREFGTRFGDDPYSKEELVAEMGAAFITATLGMEQIAPSADYIAGWLKAIRGDKKLIVSAAAKASHAADLIMGATEPVVEEVEA